MSEPADNQNQNHAEETSPQSEPQQETNNVPVPLPPTHPHTPAFQTPLPIRLFLVAATVVLFKMVYDITEQNKHNQQAIQQLSKQVESVSVAVEENRRGIERLNGGFSDIIKGVGRMGTDLTKSSRNVQMIQNDVHDEMETIRKKVSGIANQLTTLQQDLRNPFRR